MQPNVHIRLLAGILGMLLCAPAVHAAGTASGTSIVNTATATYNDGGNTVTETASVAVTVDNKVNLTVTKNADATGIPGATNETLVFVVRNDGNTPQRYALAAVNGAGIVMENVRIYRDNGTNPGAYDPADTLYVDAATFGDVPPDGTLDILIVADVPAAATSGQAADYHLLATTVNAGTTTVTTATAGAGTAGVDIVFADIAGTAGGDNARDGRHSDTGRYNINLLTLALTKSATVTADPMNGSTSPKAIPGATISYTITATVSGSGTAANVVITDPVPANATYKTGTLRLNNAALSDAVGDDAGEVAGTPLTVSVRLNDMTSASPAQNITFDVTID